MTAAARHDELRTALAAHIEDVEGVEVKWGATDCTMWPARWFAAQSGRITKPLPPYKNEAEARAHIEQAGSLEALWSWALEGVPQRSEPLLGDVGIIASHRFGQVGGIFGDDGTFFWRASRGTALLRPRAHTIIKVWACSSE